MKNVNYLNHTNFQNTKLLKNCLWFLLKTEGGGLKGIDFLSIAWVYFENRREEGSVIARFLKGPKPDNFNWSIHGNKVNN